MFRLARKENYELNHLMQLEADPDLDVPLSDICIGTSAAPTYLPAYYFTKQDEQGKVIKEFNLIDGGVAANNPVIKILETKGRN